MQCDHFSSDIEAVSWYTILQPTRALEHKSPAMTDEIKCFVCNYYSCEDVESGMCVHCAKAGYSSDVCNFMKRLHNFAYPFEVWEKKGRKNIRNPGARAQPSLAYAAGEKYGLDIGDADDWCTNRTLDELQVKTIFNLCPDQSHWDPSALQSAMKMFVKNGVVFINFPANDVCNFDIVQEVCNKGCLALIQTRDMSLGMRWPTVAVELIAVGQLQLHT